MSVSVAQKVVEIVSLLLLSMLAGTLFGLRWASARLDRRQMAATLQLLLPPLEKWFPPLCFANLGILILLAVLARDSTLTLIGALVGAVSVAALVLITVRGNVPINAEIKGWDMNRPPPGLEDQIDRWQRYNTARSVVVWLAYVLLVVAIAVRSGH
jgi:anthrone oxygenase-like protein